MQKTLNGKILFSKELKRVQYTGRGRHALTSHAAKD